MNYGRLSTLYYDLSKPFPPKVEFDFYVRELQITKSKVLEPMCGSGRFLHPLAAHGIRIEEFDKSPQMIQACASKLLESKIAAEFFQSDFHDYSPKTKYGAVIITSGSFGLLRDSDEQLVALENLQLA
jgi:2-polyprenyl-3-methyl-5-hydroxy-6-metoxy-1,4-benzoquinol methylase